MSACLIMMRLVIVFRDASAASTILIHEDGSHNEIPYFHAPTADDGNKEVFKLRNTQVLFAFSLNILRYVFNW